MIEKTLDIPLSRDDVLALKLGDIVFLNGLIFTGASSFHERAARGILPPIDFKKANVILHVGPIMREVDGRDVLLSLAPTSSIRFDAYTPALIQKLGLRAILGKTTMGKETMEVMKKFGCVHLTRAGSPDNVLVERTKGVVGVYFRDELGIAEATLLLEVERFGPFIVDIDAHGNNLFHQLEKDVEKQMESLYARYGIGTDFKYSDSMSSAKWRER